MNRHQQRDGHRQPQDPTEVENSDMYMWSRTKTWLRSIDEAIEIFGAFLMGDGGDGCLQLGDMRFERDGHPVAEAALDASR